MKIILRDLLTGLYYGGNQTWCAGVSGAMNFDSFQAAVAVALEEKLETAQCGAAIRGANVRTGAATRPVPRDRPHIHRVTVKAASREGY